MRLTPYSVPYRKKRKLAKNNSCSLGDYEIAEHASITNVDPTHIPKRKIGGQATCIAVLICGCGLIGMGVFWEESGLCGGCFQRSEKYLHVTDPHPVHQVKHFHGGAGTRNFRALSKTTTLFGSKKTLASSKSKQN